MLSATDPELVIVKVCAALVVMMLCVPKLRLVGVTVTIPPVPVRATDCGLPVALSVMTMVPVRAPATVGVNFTVIVQLPAAATEVPQLFV